MTHIVFIRREDDPETPYYTMEVSPRYEVVQVRGTHNSGMNEEVKAFKEAFETEVLDKLRRKTA